MIGQEIRLNRLVSNNKNCVIAALDAGGFFGPYEGLIDIKSTCSLLKDSDAVLLEPGNIPICRDVFLQDSPAIDHYQAKLEYRLLFPMGIQPIQDGQDHSLQNRLFQLVRISGLHP